MTSASSFPRNGWAASIAEILSHPRSACRGSYHKPEVRCLPTTVCAMEGVSARSGWTILRRAARVVLRINPRHPRPKDEVMLFEGGFGVYELSGRCVHDLRVRGLALAVHPSRATLFSRHDISGWAKDRYGSWRYCCSHTCPCSRLSHARATAWRTPRRNAKTRRAARSVASSDSDVADGSPSMDALKASRIGSAAEFRHAALSCQAG